MKSKFLVAMLLIAFALSAGQSALAAGEYYVVSNKTHYANPTTGIPDDGGDTSIGDGMCRNATYQYTLIEKDGSGAYVTLRLNTASFIKNIAITVQTSQGSDSYQDTKYTVVGENTSENTIDLRFRVSSTALLIKPKFYVDPMSRDVTYFISINGAESRDANKLALFGKENAKEDAAGEQGKAPQTSTTSSPSAVPQTGANSSVSQSGTSSVSTPQSASQGTEDAASPQAEEPSQAEQAPDEGAEGLGEITAEDVAESAAREQEPVGIVEYTAESDQGKTTESAENKSGATLWLIIALGLLLAAAATVFVIKKRKA